MRLPLRTERLVLRAFVLADVDDVLAYQRLPEVARHMLWPPRDRAQVHDVVQQMARETTLDNDGDCLTLAVIFTDTLVGQVELVRHTQDRAEIGYVFNPEHHGQGLATEAARAIVDHGFALGLRSIIGRCAAANTASANLLRRLGMREHHRGRIHVKGAWRDELTFALSRPGMLLSG